MFRPLSGVLAIPGNFPSSRLDSHHSFEPDGIVYSTSPRGGAKNLVFFFDFIEKLTFRNKGFGEMPSSRLNSNRNSVQNGMVERFTAFMATIFASNFNCMPPPLFAHLTETAKRSKKLKSFEKRVKYLSACSTTARATSQASYG